MSAAPCQTVSLYTLCICIATHSYLTRLLHLDAEITRNHLARNRMVEILVRQEGLLGQFGILLVDQAEGWSAELHPALGHHPLYDMSAPSWQMRHGLGLTRGVLAVVSARLKDDLVEPQSKLGVACLGQRILLPECVTCFYGQRFLLAELVEEDDWLSASSSSAKVEADFSGWQRTTRRLLARTAPVRSRHGLGPISPPGQAPEVQMRAWYDPRAELTGLVNVSAYCMSTQRSLPSPCSH